MFDFYSWYFALSFPAQVALGAAALAVAVLAIVLAVYVIKYVILALIWLVKAAVRAVSWVIGEIAGKHIHLTFGTAKQVEKSPFEVTAPTCYPPPATETATPATQSAGDAEIPHYCPHCGARVGPRVLARLTLGQTSFCPNCGSPVGGESGEFSAQTA
jgi:predicted RNA-binding Zn-ribbon protein involved in translation (DUF1610 family)